MDKYNFIPSFDGNHLDNQPLIVFSHIPKSAGTSFNSAIIAAYGQKGVENCLVGRIYSTNLLEIKDKITKFENNGLSVKGFISSTIPNITINTFNVPVRLITIIRGAVDRVISHYTYQCMREKTPSSISGLIEFYKSEDNQNVSCKTLMGKSNIKEGDGKACYELLQELYYAYCPVNKINTLTMSVLSTEGLPNVVIAKENYTLPEYKLTAIPEDVIKDILNLNLEDNILSEYVLNNYRIPNPVSKSSINGNTIKITCSQTEEQYKGVVESFMTTDLGKYASDVQVAL